MAYMIFRRSEVTDYKREAVKLLTSAAAPEYWSDTVLAAMLGLTPSGVYCLRRDLKVPNHRERAKRAAKREARKRQRGSK